MPPDSNKHKLTFNHQYDNVLTSPLAICAAKAAALENPCMLFVVSFRLIANRILYSVA
jgi:hypothetical protein